MSFCVRDLLNLTEFKEFKLIAGSSGLDNIITFVDTMEIPDIWPWLRKNELVVTTAYAIREDSRALGELLRQMKSAGAAGLALKTRFLGDIPPETIALADELAVPLIQIPPQFPFVEVTNPLMQALANEQNRIYQFTEKMRRQFLNMQIQGCSVNEMLELVSGLTGCSIFVADSSLHVTEQSPSKRSDLETFVEEKQGIALIRKEFAAKGKPNSVFSVVRGETTYDCIWLEIPDQISSTNYLIALGEAGTLTPACTAAIQQASSYLALELSLRERELKSQIREGKEFFDNLVNRRVSSETEAVIRAKSLHWSRPPFYISLSKLLFQTDAAETDAQKERSILKDIIPVFSRTLREFRSEHILISQENEIVCFFDASTPADEIKSALQIVHSAVLAQRSLNMISAISEPTGKYLDIASKYRALENSIQLERIDGHAGGVVLTRDTALPSLYSVIAQLPECQAFARRILGPLEEYDAVHQTNLVKTAFHLAKNLGVQNVTASELFLHRNSLAYRMKQIKELCNLDLTSRRDIETMLLATQINHYLLK